MEYFYRQSQWIGIPFTDLPVALKPDVVAGKAFFQAFYDALKEKYRTYSELPRDYRELKESTAAAIAEFVEPTRLVYSFGAGIGYVEHVLAQRHGFDQLSIWDPAAAAAHYRPDQRIQLAESDPLEGDLAFKFDCILGIQVTYALSHAELSAFLEMVRSHLQTDGRLVLVNYSPRFSENERPDQVARLSPRSMLSAARDISHDAWRRITGQRGGPEHAGAQGWGWARDNACLRAIVKAAGFSDPQFAGRAGQSILICQPVRKGIGSN